MSTKGRLLGWLGRWVLRELPVSQVETHGAFRWVTFDGALPDLVAGDKVQVLVGGDEVRTFTPVPRPGGWGLLVYVRGSDAPAMSWIGALRPGDTARFVGPQRSIRAPAGPRVVVGDETAAALGAALAATGDARVVLEVGDPEAARAALARAGVAEAIWLVRPSPAGALGDAVRDAAGGAGRAVVVAGGAALVQRARAELRAAGRPPDAVRTYWIEGRSGLD
ncbi:MAG: hypothetical protein ABMA64_07810 [Myxococcota bacterium]